ncbi:reverse transcriptase domain-containing protein [Tanacetum coccineum]
MKCQPLNFKGTEGVVGLSQWLEKMESVFHISGCAIDDQVKFTTCTLLGVALTWWNGHVRTLGHDAAYAMTWEILKNKLTEKYCPKGKIKKLEIELWNFKVKGNDVGGYTQRFQELALMCTKFLSDETEKVDKYISRLPNNIHGNVMSARPKTLDDAIELANDLMDQKLRTYAERQGSGRRSRTEDLNLCALNATITMMESVHPSAPTARKSDCPMLKNQGTESRGMVYTLGGGEIKQDINNIEDDINT